MKEKLTKEDLIARANDYIDAYNEDWEGYDDALDFATDGNTLAEMIIEYFNA